MLCCCCYSCFFYDCWMKIGHWWGGIKCNGRELYIGSFQIQTTYSAHRFQVSKWLLSKGQVLTMGTYDTLLLALDMDGRVDEAATIWSTILQTHTRSVSKRLFSRMIALYDHHHIPEKIVEVKSSTLCSLCRALLSGVNDLIAGDYFLRHLLLPRG